MPRRAVVDLPEPRHLVALAMLLWASALDLRTRRVPNLQWWPFVLAAAAFLAADAATAPRRLLLWDTGMAAAVALAAYLLFRAHLFGGADAKALMVLAFLVPAPAPDAALPYPPALSVLFNASAAVVVLPLAFLLVNLARGDVRLPAMLLGVRMRVADAAAAHVWPMERALDGQVRMRYWQRMGGGLEDAYARLAQAGVARAWVTPKVPFMVPLAIGLLAYMAWGDLLLAVLRDALAR